jgi:hypothetical protein
MVHHVINYFLKNPLYRKEIKTFVFVNTGFKGNIWTVPLLRSLVAGLSPRRPGFAPWSIHMGLLMEKVVLG